MSEHYDFHYQPTGSGAISGQQVLQQTEDAINELGDYVNDNVGGAMDVAQQALETAQNAEQDAQTALDTANSFSSAIQSAQQDASTALSTAQTAQTTASNANNTAIQASQDASSAVTTANNASGQVSTLSGTVTVLGQRVTTAEGNIGQNTSDISSLTTRVGTAEGNITTLQNDVSIAQGNASSAMATAGTVKQQAYVLRYSSSSVTDNSTIAFSTLDNTDNIKSGDKVIDVDGKIFSVVSVDTANQTVTVGSALIDLALDANVVHTTGNENVGGIKNFTDDTYIKSLNFTNEVASTSSSSSSVMPIITTVTYTDQTASKSARINLRITANGDKSLYPHENNQYALGLTTRKWSEIHGVTYYYGSSDVEFSNKFVTTDTAQEIGQNKTFTGVITINHAKGGVLQLTCPDLDNTVDVTGNWATFMSFNSVDGGQTVASKGAVGVRQFKNGKNFALLLVEGTETLYFGSKSNSDSTKALYPANSGVCSLGTSTNKWSTLNGLEPSALSMPDLANGIDISSYISYGADRYDSTYTAPANGFITIYGTCGGTASGIIITNGNYAQSSYAVRRPDLVFYAGVTLPVAAGDVMTISTNNVTSLINAKFFPCQGNV